MKLNRFCASSALVCATGMAFSGISVSAEIEEIVVTGLKKTSSVMEAPSAITALTGDDLISRGLPNCLNYSSLFLVSIMVRC